MHLARNQILVVDDLIDAADSTVELLFIWGYEAVACYSCASALNAARFRRPDVVLLDIGMPCMDGFQFAKLLHELPQCRSVPIIAVTGHSGHAYRLRARKAGIHQYLLKPAEPALLRSLLARSILLTAVSRGKRRTPDGATQLHSVLKERELVRQP
jgi:CheY-like chemotaxis protein